MCKRILRILFIVALCSTFSENCFSQTLVQYEIKGFDSIEYRKGSFEIKIYSKSENSLRLSWFITINNPGLKLKDTLDYLPYNVEFSLFREYPEYEDSFQPIEIMDYNLDNYADLRIVGDSYGSSILFTYNSVAKHFEQNDVLANFYKIILNDQDKKIVTIINPPCGTGGGYSDSTYYNIVGQNFIVDYYSNYSYYFTSTTPDEPITEQSKLITERSWAKYRLFGSEKIIMQQKDWKTDGHKPSDF